MIIYREIELVEDAWQRWRKGSSLCISVETMNKMLKLPNTVL